MDRAKLHEMLQRVTGLPNFDRARLSEIWLRAQPALRVLAAFALAASLTLAAMAQEPAKQLRVGGDVQQAKLLRNTAPVYPVLAKRGRIEGTVKLQAIIGKSGEVEKIETLSGHPVLSQAATEAVKTWRYRPTLLNGEPVEVITVIEVVFKLT